MVPTPSGKIKKEFPRSEGAEHFCTKNFEKRFDGQLKKLYICINNQSNINLGFGPKWHIIPIENINDNIGSGNNQQANTINNSFVPQTLIEQNRKTVNSIYLNTWASGIYSLTSQDSATLLNIALQNPLTNGDAVYSARVMLRIDAFNNMNNREGNFANDEKSLDIENSLVRIYPNPNNGNMTVEYTLDSDSTAVLQVFDITGKKFAEYQLMSGQTAISISEAALKNGVYFYQLLINGELISTDKIIIIR